jgi:hypothetical protein
VQRDAGIVDPIDALFHLPVELLIRSLMSLAACAERCARLRTSVTTTAKAAAGFAGARSLYRGVERQQIRLPGNLIDHPDDVGDFA